MVLERVLEPEVMDTAEEAVDYDRMDHSQVNQLFVQDLLGFVQSRHLRLQSVLDLGTGTALIPIELCRQQSSCRVTAIDMADEMLKLAKHNVAVASLADRISLQRIDAKSMPFGDSSFDACVSNSIIHHIPEPMDCIREIARVTRVGGLVFVRDLLRPKDDATVVQLVSMYAGNENDHSRQMFDDSLRAALSLPEIRELVGAQGFPVDAVTATSDRHWTWAAIKAN